ncbi:MAG TPA: universal stress protein, partial [Acidimicrobiales bacterium]|nr:universal stress protein [Acidimicrobiales bacterium]
MAPVLVAVDTSDNARAALEWAARFAAATSTPLVGVHAMGMLDRDEHGVMLPAQARRPQIEAWAEELVAAVADRFGITATSEVCDGEPVPVVLDAAQRHRAAAVVVGTRGAGRSPLTLGSTSEQLA